MVLFLAENHFPILVKQVERYRSPEQIYALMLLEPPHIIHNLSTLDNKIDWTVGYRSDADSKYVYGSFFDKETNEEIPRDPMWRGYDTNAVSPYVLRTNIPEIVQNKKKLVAWFVSNCDRVQSERMELAQALNRYIPVDIYGKCGTLQCARGDEKCNDMLEADYKFYLSFENALCRDYITEKAYKIMKRAVIPVIYSGADLGQLLPPKSYINAEDFATIDDLANYLIYLAGNPEEYMSYFWWKEYYTVGQMHYSCYLCQQLNDWDRSKQIARYEHIGKWYNDGACRKPTIRFT